MHIHYDEETNILLITLRPDRIADSDEIAPNVIADFNEAGAIIRFEILDAPAMIAEPRRVELSIQPALVKAVG